MLNTMFKLYFLHFLSDLDVLGLVGKPKVIGKLVQYSPHIAGLLYAGNFRLVFHPHIIGLLYVGRAVPSPASGQGPGRARPK